MCVRGSVVIGEDFKDELMRKVSHILDVPLREHMLRELHYDLAEQLHDLLRKGLRGQLWIQLDSQLQVRVKYVTIWPRV